MRLLDNLAHGGLRPDSPRAPGVDLAARHLVVHAHEVLDLPIGAAPARHRRVFPEIGLVERLDELGFGGPAPPGEPRVALTSFNLNPLKLLPAGTRLSSEDLWRFRSKATLRAVVAHLGRGLASIDLYRAQEVDVGLVDLGAPAGGAVLGALGRLTSRFAPGEDAHRGRSLHLRDVRACAGVEAEIEGEREAPRIAFFPFQRGGGSFVAAVYVMTTDLLRASDPPATPHLLVLSGTHPRRVSLYDPLDDVTLPLVPFTTHGDEVRIQLPLTDSPRLLLLEEDPATEAKRRRGDL
jgi:hypothetical protein